MMSLLSSATRKGKPVKNKRQEEPLELPLDVLRDISKKFDNIDDLFSLGQVCKYWRMIHSDHSWRDFIASGSPLIVQKARHDDANRLFFFYSIPESRTYNTMLPCFSGFNFAGFSSGYMIMIGDHSVRLINPFARKMIKIPTRPSNLLDKQSIQKAILSFDAANSDEFILVLLTNRVHNMLIVYQSRNSIWSVDSRISRSPWSKVFDVVVFDNTIYTITEKAEIGIVMLNPQKLKLLNLSNMPIIISGFFNFVSSNDDDDDEQLRVVHFQLPHSFEVYRIDFCTLSWIKLKTLVDNRSLFHLMGSNPKCYSLSNPSKWGFRSNCMYYIKSYSNPKCEVLSMDEQKVIETILIPQNPAPPTTNVMVRNVDWCF